MGQLQTKYITPDDFRDYFGIDLSILKDDTNPSNKQMAFLKRIEDRMESMIDAECFRKVSVEYPNFSDYQKEHYKRALLEQAIYIYKNGDISVDSGMDPEKGVIIDDDTIDKLSLARNAKRELQLCGLWSKKIRMSDWAGTGLWSC